MHLRLRFYKLFIFILQNADIKESSCEIVCMYFSIKIEMLPQYEFNFIVVQAFILWIHEKLFQMANFKHYFIVSFAKLFLAGCARKLSHLKPHSCYISYVQRTFFAEIYSLSHKWYQKVMGYAFDLCFFSKKKISWRS